MWTSKIKSFNQILWQLFGIFQRYSWSTVYWRVSTVHVHIELTQDVFRKKTSTIPPRDKLLPHIKVLKKARTQLEIVMGLKTLMTRLEPGTLFLKKFLPLKREWSKLSLLSLDTSISKLTFWNEKRQALLTLTFRHPPRLPNPSSPQNNMHTSPGSPYQNEVKCLALDMENDFSFSCK